ncbi:antiviral reverse transcriptase Drt3a [Psychrobacter sp. Marseille-P5312]|uniref:antiviral reverse transcriptase Drt3a n=1 Tax=Psychrobacter sp. Marseille-P5312 TaxID=2086574 RepID=UPI000CF635BA|nr:antiviral reverse transcriptase Drt3a [Psychrobacter sp. Marseille-P5312]
MLDQSINESSLKYIINDFEKKVKFKDDFSEGDDAVVCKLLQEYSKNQPFPPLEVIKVRKKTAYTVCDIYSYYLLKRLNLTFKTINSLKQANRNEIVSSIVALIKDKRPYNIIRLDIKDFYESIDRNTILQSIEQDIAYSKSTTNILRKWFNCFEESKVFGLPRGLSISASLAEYYLREFDESTRRIDGVFYYARFVDDIIVFTTRPEHEIIATLENNLPLGLKFHSKNNKRAVIEVPIGHKNSNENLSFNYLGYEFTITIIGRKLETRVDFSNVKINSIKTKIVKALLDFERTSDFILLKSRLSFLTHNYYIHNKYRDTKIRSGIYYNYLFISHPLQCRLKDLDSFMRNLLFNKSLCKRIIGQNHSLSNEQCKILIKMSFSKGYNNKLFHKFGYRKMMQIKSCWSF